MSAWKADALPLGDARFYPREIDFTVMVKSGQAYTGMPAHASVPAYVSMPIRSYASISKYAHQR